MKKLAKVFFAASVVSLAVSLTGPGSEFMWGFLKPLSAMLFGAFFISNLLAKEYREYDQEQEYRLKLARQQNQEAPADESRDAHPVGQTRFAH